jgi:hypothetical protein
MSKKAIAAAGVLLLLTKILLASGCPDAVGTCPTNSGYCIPSYASTSPDDCLSDCGYYPGGGKLTKTGFWQIVFTGGHVDGPFAVRGYGQAHYNWDHCELPYCWPTFYCPTTDCAYWER